MNTNQKAAEPNPATAHTSGPWSHGEPFIITRSAPHVIGFGNGAEHIGYASITGCIPESQALANAKLICAAPDLLALCLDLRRCDPNNGREIRRLQLRASKLAQEINGTLSKAGAK